ncbi:ferric reductase NAD binding domain-domain-containing protein [Leucosporidium creatinivorum]|uniref:Ferric reductase NAD binding domain-domain-containing protein n=1 Tax=Leucosporidium creatinivorum TaxID=106004 RepID=A0A1Y2FA03_9BASI|nr:ferric reductase NAD binding domain-domain-containing protein [Leucosporidium creatinivorum]
MVSFSSFVPRKGTAAPAEPKQLRKYSKFSSGLDFSDGRPPSFAAPLTPPPDVRVTTSKLPAPSLPLRKNKSEQTRLQGLMRGETMDRRGVEGQGSVSWWKQLRIWTTNEGARRIFFGIWILVHALVFAFGFLNYALKDNLVTARQRFGVTYEIARSAALVLHVEVALILLPVCRSFISLLRRGPLNAIIPFEKSINFHQATAWGMVIFTIVHVGAHLFNAWWLAEEASTSIKGRVVAFLEVNFTTGPGVTGWIMTVCLAVMVWFAAEKRRRAHFELFWYSHHLFIVFFINWQLHGMFCFIKPDRPPYCSYQQIGVFWKYWLVGGLLYIAERVLREVRSRHRTYISKVILHPSNVCEVHIKKEKTTTRAGQYIFLNCPEVSYWQWHPFTLTSAPEEDYISVHIRCVGDFTKSFATILGCKLSDEGEKEAHGAEVVPPPMNRILPRVMVDGPFGSASEDVFKFEVSVLVGAGIGVTPFASILKSIWYRLNYPQSKKSRLSKVYFFWVCRDYYSFEWFQSLLEAIEAQDLDNCIEIHTYLTARLEDDDLTNIFANDVGGQLDAVTNLRAPTHYGRPNWDRIFQSVAEKHPATEVGVVFCGVRSSAAEDLDSEWIPKALGSTLHTMCNKHTDGKERGVKFHWGKENF